MSLWLFSFARQIVKLRHHDPSETANSQFQDFPSASVVIAKLKKKSCTAKYALKDCSIDLHEIAIGDVLIASKETQNRNKSITFEYLQIALQRIISNCYSALSGLYNRKLYLHLTSRHAKAVVVVVDVEKKASPMENANMQGSG